MQNLIDYRTLLAASGIVGGALLMLLAMQRRHPYPGFLRMVLGMDVLAAAFIAGGLKGYAPDTIWILQVTAFATLALVGSGIKIFCELPRHGLWPYLYVLFGMALQTYLYFAQPLYLAIVATSFLLIPIALDAGIQLLKAPAPEGRQFGYRFVAAVALLTVATSVVRLVAMGLLRHEASPYFAASLPNSLFFLMVLVLIVTMSFGIITLAHERLVAELKAEHDDRLRVQQQLARTERIAAVGRVVGGIAHFLNNQMTVIQVACSLLQDPATASTATAASLVEKIGRAATRISSITGRLQQYAQSKMLRISRFDPSRLLDEILQEVRATAGEDVEVVISSSSKVPAVELDPDLLKEAMLAVTRNARDAMPGGGRLTISLRKEVVDSLQAEQLSLLAGTFVVTSLADTGRGMNEEIRGRVFEPFFTTKGLSTAEGLGLASAYGFIRQSGGTIVVISTPEQGSTFHLYLPASSASPDTIAA